MFGFLKKKFSNTVELISNKFKKKEEMVKILEKEIEEKTKEMERKSPEDVISEIKTIAEKTGIKEDIEKIIKTEPIKDKGFFKKFTEKIKKIVLETKLSEKDLEDVLNDLEVGLIEADTAFDVAQKIKNDLKVSLLGKEVKRGKEREFIIDAIKKSLLEILSVPTIDMENVIKKAKSENRPAVFLFFGTNGVGKSLNLSKVAFWLKQKGYKPILAAGDTFRAAGDIQLEKYAEIIKVPVIKQKTGADSCAVIFDTVKAAKARGYDCVLADTSGRMHTKKDLLAELEKIVRVNKPDLKILVLDSLSGSDVLNQFEFFDKAVGIDAVIFSKVDVNEKGGNILSICHLFKRPILFVGTGQKPEDLEVYDPEKFVKNMIEI